MNFRVTGQNRVTGARQIQNFEAASKAAAERLAEKSGIDVNRVEEILPGAATHGTDIPTVRKGTRMRSILLLLILLAAAIMFFMNWSRVKSMLGM